MRRHAPLARVPLVPEIRLHMAHDATELWQQTENDLDQMGLPPPFWAFAWAGGQALARFILDHPESVAGRSVLDVASGSGLVAIAAAMGRAAAVEANDIDAFALEAIRLNAEANGVGVVPRLGSMVGSDEGWEVVLAADIFYERDTAALVTEWLRDLAARGASVMVGDPGRSYFDATRFRPLAAYDVPVLASLENADSKRSGVWRVLP